ncbi:2-amino-4-hydroxy-6-hydroxymethyldihydropteridine diphosphokinase [uncultured Dokdonia sp.]|uniref:2-amino-4-hydroxy-6- hydroxymethyldihydropteridine diphosphokinase n=1 Tax=uncultured Dokdonia sp. TaxID=575653 RepID=UPI002606BDD9|nr:2-amino-4-hydroxy-6-hydroxymethyldihydropteridine diphosphokinase [uncultured Dokdonia sp.]
MHTIYLSLGSNQGNTYENLSKAIELLFAQVGRISKISPVYQSPALGFEGPDFHNCVIRIHTHISSAKLLKKILEIEMAMGRTREEGVGYQSRPIDIDILLYDDAIIDTAILRVPHPRMCERRFVLQPLADIAGDVEHPIEVDPAGVDAECHTEPVEVHGRTAKTYLALLETCADESVITKQPKWLKNPKDDLSLGSYNYIVIEGNIGAGKTSLVEMISQEFNAKPILERYKDNPFLPKFYKEPERYAFPLEMSFLADRYQQLLDDIGQYDLFKDFMIADYDRYKSLIFSKVTLQEEEYVLYKRLHEMMYRDMPQPDLYVYLYQNTERLLKNIKKRGRSYEKDIDANYLEKINQGYLDFIKSQHQLNVKIIDISDLDFVKNREDYLKVVSEF